MRILAMIPARLGSKRIPKKNIRYMNGKPLIEYALDLGLGCKRFDEVWINTESEPLGMYAKGLGVKFHHRPDELASDTATNRDFTYQFLKEHDCEYVVMINPTSPLLRPETLDKFMDTVTSGEFDTLLSVVEEKEETFFKGIPLNFTFDKKINSQMLEPVEKIVWSLTAWKRSTFLALQENGKNPVFGGRVGRFPIPKDESCDIDTEEDWKIAEGTLLSRETKYDERYVEL